MWGKLSVRDVIRHACMSLYLHYDTLARIKESKMGPIPEFIGISWHICPTRCSFTLILTIRMQFVSSSPY